MEDSELIRRVFARIDEEPESARTALRQKIVRALRGGQQAEECKMIEGGERTLQERTVMGRDIVARKRAQHYADRLIKLQALQKTILTDLPEVLHPHLPTLRESGDDEYQVTLRIDGYAPLMAKWFYSLGQWRREFWPKGWQGSLWAVEPWPQAHISMWRYVEGLDEALAIAEDCYPAHLVLTATEEAATRPRSTRWQRLVDWLALRIGARLWSE